MATWRDRLPLEGDGSFRGVRFQVSETRSRVGRRGKLHEFPGRADPFFEDMSRAPRAFSLTCFVLGDNYDVARDELREAFETEGSGELVHPYWGTFQVSLIDPVELPELAGEQGIVTWSMNLVQVVDRPITRAVVDPAEEVEVKADAAAAAVSEEFAEEFSVLKAIDSVRQSAISNILALNTAFAAARSRVNSALAIVDDVADGITAIASGIAALILLPQSLANSVRGVMTAALSAVARIDNALSTLIDSGAQDTAPGASNLFGDYRAQKTADYIGTLAANGADLAPTISTEGAQSSLETTNRDASVQLYRCMGVIEGVRAISNLDFESRNTALTIAATLDGYLYELGLDAGDALYGAISDLREAFARQMAAKAEALPLLVSYTPPEARPVLAIAYDIHGDADREPEIIARNNISDPSGVQTLVPIKVLIDA